MKSVCSIDAIETGASKGDYIPCEDEVKKGIIGQVFGNEYFNGLPGDPEPGDRGNQQQSQKKPFAYGSFELSKKINGWQEILQSDANQKGK